MSDINNLIDRLGATALDCRKLIREMHEAEQSLKQTIKDARAAKDDIDKYLTKGIEESVRRTINELGEHTQKAMHKTSEKIVREFDKLAKPLHAAIDDIHAHLEQVAKQVRE